MKNQGVSNKSYEVLRIELEQKENETMYYASKERRITRKKRQMKIQNEKQNIEEDKRSSSNEKKLYS